jgi:hypothetical protein
MGFGWLRNYRESEFPAHLEHRLVFTHDLADEFANAALLRD